ncbi:MAG: PAS domain S-box protein [Thermodesulfobacteriota bacterium]
MHDISATKAARQQVRIAEEKTQLLSQAVEQAGDSVLITDREGSIEFVNTAFTRITGFTPTEAIGKTPSILKSGEQSQAFYEQMWSTITKGEPWQGRLVDQRKNGDRYPAELSISPVQNGEGEITHFIGIKRDLTEREALERQFQQAQKMEAIGTLVGGIAHDFNNILAGITGSLFLAKQRTDEMPEVLGRLNNIESLSYRAADMIQQLLIFARKDQVTIKQMPLTPFIKETLKLLRPSVPENVTFQHQICSDPLQIKGDGTQLHQVLMNLINNARDAVESMDAPRITVRLEEFYGDALFTESHPSSTGRDFARLSVADNGCGIAADQIEHLFEPFYTTKEVGRGTGLGLAMVFGAIKSHGGFVEVESATGNGSTFHIYIPQDKPQDIPQELPPSSLLERRASDGQGETILVADDEPYVREIIAEVLETLGYNVLQAEDGLEAIHLFEAHKKDIALAVLDVVMPYCGGMKLAKKIRSLSSSLPILFLTGYDKAHALGSEEMEESKILTKPVQLDALSHTIRQLLD